MISGDITMARLLDEHPELIEVLARYHSHFKQLRNRLLRRIMAPRVTVAQAARMAGVPADELLAVLRHAVGEPAPGAPHLPTPHPALSPEGRGSGGTLEGRGSGGTLEGRGSGGTPEGRGSGAIPEGRGSGGTPEGRGSGGTPEGRGSGAIPEGRGSGGTPEGRGGPESPSPFQGEGRGEGGRPRSLSDVPEARQVHLDVREDIQRGREPFARIMAAVKALAGDQALVLRVPFEPIPLYDVLGKRGFAHWTERRASDDWSVWFYRDTAPRVEPTAALAAPVRRRTVLDVRGLEPPQPMLRVLQELDWLAPGAELEVHHDRRPMFLYPQLDERGFIHETDEPEPGLVRILIRSGAA